MQKIIDHDVLGSVNELAILLSALAPRVLHYSASFDHNNYRGS
jgi:hypothetical protein